MADQVKPAPAWVSVARMPTVVMAVPDTSVWLAGVTTVTVLMMAAPVMAQVKPAEPEAPEPSVAVTLTE